jgi:hypothetical protein
MIDDDRPGLLLIASDAAKGLALVEAADNPEWVALLHGLLGMLGAAAREVCTEMGLLAIGVALEDVADCDRDPDRREAARLILAHNAARMPEAESAFCDFGAGSFNEVLERVDANGRLCEVTVAVATVWRSQLPWLFTEPGLQILRRVGW